MRLALRQEYLEYYAILFYIIFCLWKKRNTKNPANKQALAAETVVPFRPVHTCVQQTR